MFVFTFLEQKSTVTKNVTSRTKFDCGRMAGNLATTRANLELTMKYVVASEFRWHIITRVGFVGS